MKLFFLNLFLTFSFSSLIYSNGNFVLNNNITVNVDSFKYIIQNNDNYFILKDNYNIAIFDGQNYFNYYFNNFILNCDICSFNNIYCLINENGEFKLKKFNNNMFEIIIDINIDNYVLNSFSCDKENIYYISDNNYYKFSLNNSLTKLKKLNDSLNVIQAHNSYIYLKKDSIYKFNYDDLSLIIIDINFENTILIQNIIPSIIVVIDQNFNFFVNNVLTIDFNEAKDIYFKYLNLTSIENSTLIINLNEKDLIDGNQLTLFEYLKLSGNFDQIIINYEDTDSCLERNFKEEYQETKMVLNIEVEDKCKTNNYILLKFKFFFIINF